MLSVIMPAYHEEVMIKKAVSVISSILADASISRKLPYADDGSKNVTVTKITALSSSNPVIHVIYSS